jgi:hypothetical protein
MRVLRITGLTVSRILDVNDSVLGNEFIYEKSIIMKNKKHTYR